MSTEVNPKKGDDAAQATKNIKPDVKKKTSKGKNKKKIEQDKKPYIIAIAVLVLVLIGVLIYTFWPKPEEEEFLIRDPSVPRAILPNGGVTTPENVEQERERLGVVTPDAQFTVSMARTWRFETALTPSNLVYFENVESNSRMVFFDVILKDTNELVYSSPYIPLGRELTNFALDKDLSAGTYDATILITLVDDDFNMVADLSVTTKLIIEN